MGDRVGREQVCRLMNCQKLSIEVSTHAAQNERLPLRVVVQVLFFEQLRLRTYVAGWYFFSDNLEHSQDLSGKKEGEIVKFGEMKERVCGLEKECDEMKEEMDKLAKRKRNWIIEFYKKCNLKVKTKSFDLKSALAILHFLCLQQIFHCRFFPTGGSLPYTGDVTETIQLSVAFGS